MSIESAKSFIAKINSDPAFKEKLAQAASGEDRRKIVTAAGFDFNKEELQTIRAKMSPAEIDRVLKVTRAAGGTMDMQCCEIVD